MSHLSFILFSALSIVLVHNVSTGSFCSMDGISITCPTRLDSKDKQFCCESREKNVLYCCDADEFYKNHPEISPGISSGTLVGIAIAALVVFILIILGICCCCSCCCLYKRRVRVVVSR